MRDTFVLAAIIAVAAVAALVIGFVLSKSGIVLEDFSYLSTGHSGVKSTLNQSAEINNDSAVAGQKSKNSN
jgi:hypothetical protein